MNKAKKSARDIRYLKNIGICICVLRANVRENQSTHENRLHGPYGSNFPCTIGARSPLLYYKDHFGRSPKVVFISRFDCTLYVEFF